MPKRHASDRRLSSLQVTAKEMAEKSMPSARRFPPPWDIERPARLLHRERQQRAGARLCLLRAGARSPRSTNLPKAKKETVMFEINSAKEAAN